MYDQRFFDQVMVLIESDQIESALPLVMGNLQRAHAINERWESVKASIRSHRFHTLMGEDPFVARCRSKPRGYPGDAVVIDMVYDQVPPEGTSQIGKKIFDYTTSSMGCEAVRQRCNTARARFETAVGAGEKILCLAGGHLREADHFVGKNLRNVTVVDQDRLSLEAVRSKHGDAINLICTNAFSYLRSRAASDAKFDFVYTLGLTDYLNDRAMDLLHKLVLPLLPPQGKFMLANFLPNHLEAGWMDAVMDWPLIHRDVHDLESFALRNGFKSKTWIEPTRTIAWCEMTPA